MAKGKYQKWLTPEGLLLLEGWARDGLSEEQIAKNMGINAVTLYRWKEKYCNGYLYTVTEDLTLSSGAGTLKVDQNIPATISTPVSALLIKKAHALGFHRKLSVR
ncbi:MAG: hypothetical protein ABS876_06955 [Ruminococcus sp.]